MGNGAELKCCYGYKQWYYLGRGGVRMADFIDLPFLIPNPNVFIP
jgi:hypothetical protein